MIVVEFRLDHPVLREALAEVPGMRVEWEQSNAIDESRVRMLVWAVGDDFDAFEDALENDPTVESPRRVAEVGDRRLYQTELINEGLDASIYPILVEEGGVVGRVRATHEGWEYRVAFPIHSSVDRFFARCERHNIQYEIHRLRVDGEERDADFSVLTDEQAEALDAAMHCGYFEVPRECTLQDLSHRLDISDSAVSQRLRRGIKSLIQENVDRGEGTDRLTLRKP